MRRRLVLTALMAAVLMLLVAGAADARAARSSAFAWQLQLRNMVDSKYSRDVDAKAFALATLLPGRKVTIVENGVRYTGPSLRTVVGMFDDRRPNRFDTDFAARGYTVIVVGMDGYTASFSSQLIEKLGDRLILASQAAGEPLPVPKAFLENGQAVWYPDWPLRIASSDAGVTVDDKVQGVVRLVIVPAASPNQPYEPFAWVLQLRSDRLFGRSSDLDTEAFAAMVERAGRVTVVQNGVRYSGPSLRDVVGMADDGNPLKFNEALARKGYKVTVLGMDGYSHTFPVSQIASLGDGIILADQAAGAALPVPGAVLLAGVPIWVPDWPLRIVCNDPGVVEDDQVRGVLRITLVKK